MEKFSIGLAILFLIGLISRKPIKIQGLGGIVLAALACYGIGALALLLVNLAVRRCVA